MDFDEYDYLEKTVENSEPQKSKETANGGDIPNKAEHEGGKRSSKHKKGDENRDDSNQRLKRMKSEVESHGHDRERGSLRHHSSSKGKDRSERDWHRTSQEHRDKDKDWDTKKNRKDRDRDKDQDWDQERRERDRENERERDRDGERERERERFHQSRSHMDRLRNEWDRERIGEREYIDKEGERDFKERDLGSRQYKEKKEEAAEPEVDPERDQRTVFAYQISLKADERDVYEFFSRAGKVRDVRLIMGRNSRRSKGVGYIEFYDVMSVPMAIALSGQPLLGQLVMVKLSEAENNLVQSTTSASGGMGGLIGPYSGGARRLYVRNLHLNMKEDQLRQVFEPFGTVELVQLPSDLRTGHCKGYGFVQFARLEDARAAQGLDGQLEIAGRTIKVSADTDQAGTQDTGSNSDDLDDDEGGGLSVNACSRAVLMQKLDWTGTSSSITGLLSTLVTSSPVVVLPTAPILGPAPPVSPIVQTPLPALAGFPVAGLSAPNVNVPSVDLVGVPSECVLLKNMFDPKLETEPDFDLDIKEDVEDECSKFGSLKHIYVDKNSTGFVYLQFEDTESAISAQRALHGRWFAGKMITATFMLSQNSVARFPESR